MAGAFSYFPRYAAIFCEIRAVANVYSATNLELV